MCSISNDTMMKIIITIIMYLMFFYVRYKNILFKQKRIDKTIKISKKKKKEVNLKIDKF